MSPDTTGRVLVLNAGSSSLKYQLIDPATAQALAAGVVERIGEGQGSVSHTTAGETTTREQPIPDHGVALKLALGLFDEVGPRLTDADIRAVGHRVVHGGAVFTAPTVITDDVVRAIEELSTLAPLHNPPAVRGIEVARALLPVPHVAVFDTAFFAALPPAAATYAIDRDVAQAHGVRRYGFHGTSHEYVSGQVAQVLGRPVAEVNSIVLHLGNGASASAVRGGVPVETSMGLTPLEGLVMGTRSGDIDPAVVFHLARVAGLSVDHIDDLLNKRSGIKGLAGVNDMRELRALIDAGDADAQLAFEVYVHRLRKYIGAYYAVLGRVDAIAFTAGIGENDAQLRAAVIDGLDGLGITVDPAANAERGRFARSVSPASSPVQVLVIPTMEELAIAQHCLAAISGD